VKTCSRCGVGKALTEFRKHKGTKSGYGAQCRPCWNDYKIAWRKNNRDKQIAQNHRERLRKYGLTQEEYDRLLAEQGGRCPICLTTEGTDGDGEWSIDHDHETGQVRGLLCGHCNRAIGLLRDNIANLTRAQAYLEK